MTINEKYKIKAYSFVHLPNLIFFVVRFHLQMIKFSPLCTSFKEDVPKKVDKTSAFFIARTFAVLGGLEFQVIGVA